MSIARIGCKGQLGSKHDVLGPRAPGIVPVALGVLRPCFHARVPGPGPPSAMLRPPDSGLGDLIVFED